MVRTREMTLSLPPFTKAVTWLLAINTAIFLLLELFGDDAARCRMFISSRHFSLQPFAVVHGWLWQLVTYSFLHAGFWHWFGNMLALWMFGSTIEGSWGTRRFVELFSFGVLGAAFTTIVLSYTHAIGNPLTPTVGASGGVYAVLMAFGMVFGENQIMMIPFPFTIKAKYFVAILIVVELCFCLGWRRQCRLRRPSRGIVLRLRLCQVDPAPRAQSQNFPSNTTACETAITAGSAAGRPANSKSTCGNTTAR